MNYVVFTSPLNLSSLTPWVAVKMSSIHIKYWFMMCGEDFITYFIIPYCESHSLRIAYCQFFTVRCMSLFHSFIYFVESSKKIVYHKNFDKFWFIVLFYHCNEIMLLETNFHGISMLKQWFPHCVRIDLETVTNFSNDKWLKISIPSTL